MITFKHSGNFNNTEKFFKRSSSNTYFNIFEKYAKDVVDALSQATPIDSGETAQSWGYDITNSRNGVKISWTNSNIVDGVPIAVLIQYGHGTRNGGYVEGHDFINPTVKPMFDKLTNDLWREVSK